MLQPEKGREKPVIRRALDLYAADNIPVIYHKDTVEVRFAEKNVRLYSTWSQFLADAESLFGDRLLDRFAAANAAAAAAAEPAPFTEFPKGPKAPPAGEAFRAYPGFGPTAEPAANGAEKPAEPSGEGVKTSTPSWDPKAPPAEQIRALRTQLRVMEKAVYVVGTQSEEAKKEIAKLQRQLAAAKTEIDYLSENRPKAFGNAPDRYKQLRQVIVRKLHPDVAGTDLEKQVRESLFKAIWSEIETLDKNKS